MATVNMEILINRRSCCSRAWNGSNYPDLIDFLPSVMHSAFSIFSNQEGFSETSFFSRLSRCSVLHMQCSVSNPLVHPEGTGVQSLCWRLLIGNRLALNPVKASLKMRRDRFVLGIILCL